MKKSKTCPIQLSISQQIELKELQRSNLLKSNNFEAADFEGSTRATLIDELWFIANQVGLPELFLFNNELVADDDHCFHELLCVDSIESAEPIDYLINGFEEANKTGWREFDPLYRNLGDYEPKSLGF